MTTCPRLFVFPGGIDPDVLAIGSEPVPYARTDQFAAMVIEIEGLMLPLLGCSDGRLLSLTASGSAAMEAAVSNLVGADSRVLVIEGGTFGKRWVDMIQRYSNGRIDVEHVPFGADLDYDRIERLVREGSYNMLFMQHHETSSGVKFDVSRIGPVCRVAGTLLVVDAISSFLADEFSMDDANIDVAILSSQKGLCLPPGLSFVVLGRETLRMTQLHRRGSYFDFVDNLDSLARGHPLFTPAVQLYRQLHRRLLKVTEGGVQNFVNDVRAKAIAFRELLNADGRPQIVSSPSNCLTSFNLRGPTRVIIDGLATAGFYVMPSSQPHQVRVAHLGTSTQDDHQMLFQAIRDLEARSADTVA